MIEVLPRQYSHLHHTKAPLWNPVTFARKSVTSGQDESCEACDYLFVRMWTLQALTVTAYQNIYLYLNFRRTLLESLGVSCGLLGLAASNTQKHHKTLLFTAPEPLGAPKTVLFTALQPPGSQFQAPSGATGA